MPTIARLSNATLPANALDGVDIWPVLSAQQTRVDHDAFLYFDSWPLQCVRLGPWKPHVARYSDFAGNPRPPEAGRQNLPLPNPELYTLENDPDESYSLAWRSSSETGHRFRLPSP